MLIEAEHTSGSQQRTFPTYNPATGDLIAHVPDAGDTELEAAVQAARHSIRARSWQSLSPSQRGKILWTAADLIDSTRDELARIETTNNGMPLHIARDRIGGAAEIFRYYAGWCTKIHGVSSELAIRSRNFHAYTLREPIGVVAVITPFNMPFLLASLKVAPALAAGCSVILKPAEQTPLSALKLGQLLKTAGVPAGVCTVLTGQGASIGAALAAHAGIDKVTFTGSTSIGRKIIAAASGNLKKVSLELGGKSPVLVFADANMELAIDQISRGIFSNAGQMCVAGSRLYIHRTVYNEVVEGVARRATSLKVGDGFNPDNEIGPLISRRQLDHVSELVRSGIQDGGELVVGGAPLGEKGYFFKPTVISSPPPRSRLIREEIFGPVVAAMAFDDTEEAIEAANDTEYGLAAAVWTSDLSKAHECVRRLAAGTVWVNCQLVNDPSMPFGGYKTSGWGRESGWDGIEAFLQTKSVFAGF